MAETKRLEVNAGALSATLRDVTLPIGLRLDELTLDAQDVSLIADPWEVRTAEPGDVTVRVGEAAVTQYLEDQAPAGLGTFRVKLLGGQLLIEASVKLIVTLQAKVVCTLRIEDESKLYVDLADSAGLPPGVGSIIEAQLARVNPLLDAKDLPVSMRLLSVAVEDGQILLSGKISA